PVTITLDFASAVNLTDFYLWNHSNNNGAGAPSAGVEDFTLTFYDGAGGGGSQIGSVFSSTASAAPATGTYAAQVFDLGATYSNVRSAELVIASRIGGGTSFVAIRELGFEAIPEPGALSLLGLGLASFLLRRRR
ncbi:PEP-CTERM sorting domain-containing protein, partial [Haloferula sp. A504]|uniref:PEP-CTERM sorting domain-containing protein n=1 Tax=Haloferula sp. A504 TaxID=3373601 RepID=UPI0031C5F2EF|nr:PEP-CTERM sorting domain-containing protein [Verrucomicrobiaceae bacterium E54]